ncbi:hypothetical protein IRZ81_14330 [Pseudomonas putida]|uniref:hypothetical protein n=1 Tax=Pseudomonas putida TaxID=303 RepID=UPI0018AAD27E|nr:hypothetical protein [Pseudomonas putida]MBF8651972.1 hypothetical protein [Pseudomonas putida]MBF8655924.1 hypothetical protein [Pseudomonas putida]
MRIIEPVEITPSMAVMEAFLVEPNSEPLVVQVGQAFQVASMLTNVPEADYPLWMSTTAYAVGDIVMLEHRSYEALVANSNKNPTGGATDPPTWLDLGPTNRWRMFDDKIGTVTTNPESISLTIAPGRAVDSLAFFGLDAASIYVRVVDPYQGIVYESSVSPVSTDGINDWYEYFFAPVEVNEDFVLLDVPVGSYGSIEIKVAKPAGIAKVGALILGKAAVLGDTLYGTSVGITDYSRKERDDFGNTVIVERDYSKRADFDVMVPTSMVSQVQRLLSKHRAKPLVWIGEASYQSTILYGYYKEFNLVISGPTASDCSISVEGLI